MTIHLINGNSRRLPLRAESVHMIVTSPPYWNLRDYGTASWSGGDPDCDHLAGPLASTKSGLACYTGEHVKLAVNGVPYKGACGRCGAVRIDNQIGLETMHDCNSWASAAEPCGSCFVCTMRIVFREAWRVLRPDGTLWLNLGDSYQSNGSTQVRQSKTGSGLAPKNMVGTPWRVALALQADGWILRSDIIWSKPNPIPESVRDRPTKAHEYLFLFSKGPRYFYDRVAVLEDFADSSLERIAQSTFNTQTGGPKDYRYGTNSNKSSRQALENFATAVNSLEITGRNRRTVWTVATRPYSGAHFATFPPDLVEPCIKAGSSEGGVCGGCGRPWRRVGNSSAFRPACRCGADKRPAVVLDLFSGSGTTGLVARALGRDAILVDLSLDYLSNQARARLELDRLEEMEAGAGIVDNGDPDLSGLPLFSFNGNGG